MIIKRYPCQAKLNRLHDRLHNEYRVFSAASVIKRPKFGLNVLEANGINTAIGMDEAGINDDRDMLQEMRLVLRAHRVPGITDDAPTPAQLFRMATAGGAKT